MAAETESRRTSVARNVYRYRGALVANVFPPTLFPPLLGPSPTPEPGVPVDAGGNVVVNGAFDDDEVLLPVLVNEDDALPDGEGVRVSEVDEDIVKGCNSLNEEVIKC